MKRRIFVLMPFKPELENTLFAIEQATAGIAQVERANQPITEQAIMDRIYEGIEEADLVVADLTDSNPNVFYEVGYAHALGKPIFFVAASTHSDLPFDLRGYPVMQYSTTSSVPALVKQLKPRIDEALRVFGDSSQFRVPLGEALRMLGKHRPKSEIFGALMSERAGSFATEVARWVKGTMRVDPEEALEKGMSILQHLRKRGFATFLVTVDKYWFGQPEYLEAARSATRDRGCEITRAFIIFDRSSMDNPNLKKCIEEDGVAGIKTMICFADRIADQESIHDFGIWDDNVLCLMETVDVAGATDVTGCVFSTDPSELARARKWEDTILANSEPAEVVLDRYGQVARPEQPLAVSAAKMAELAARHCKGSYLSQMSCRWYHGSWQYLRLVNVVSTPDWHFDFYKRSVGEAARLMPVGKILICGMADYGMLAHLLADLSSEQRVKYEITALDLCATPLRICEWFAERQSVELRTLEEDALDMGLRDSWFGLILTDAFLSRFTDRERKEVVAEWRRVLAPGGFVVTTARVEETSEKVVGSAADVSAFVERARNAALELRRRNMLPCSIEDIETMASEYAQKIVSYPLTSDELQTLFAGFEMTHERSCTPGEFGQTSYARIVARKPAR